MGSTEQMARRELALDEGWEFARRRVGRAWLLGGGAADESVDLPHCWNTGDTFRDGVRYYRGHGAYRVRLRVPEWPRDPACAWLLESGGFYGTGDVWVNGVPVSRIDGQYLGFRLEVGQSLAAQAEATVGVRLTNRCAKHVLPGIDDPDFILYGGLSGRVRLVCLPSLHISSDSFRFVTAPGENGAWHAAAEAGVTNRSARSRTVVPSWTIFGPDCATVVRYVPGRETVIPAQSSVVVSASLRIEGAERWTLERPTLYRAVLCLDEAGEEVDRAELRVGFRGAAFRDGEGFFLNGVRTELRGCNRHESMPGFGRALPEGLSRQDACVLKDMGMNFVRLSHYPQHPAFLDACDELGLLAYAEIATWKSVRTGRWLDAACRQMRDMVRRDRHHPSVIVWGMGNESRSRRAFERLRATVLGEDDSRPVTYAENHIHRARRAHTVGMPDIWGCNYELDILDACGRASRSGNVLVTECSNEPTAQRGDREAELRQVTLIEGDLSRLRGRADVAGYALWCFNDYATMRKERFRRYSGLVDAWRMPKLSAFLVSALCLDRPFVKLVADWREPGVGSDRGPDRQVHVFTSCESTVLLCGGGKVEEFHGRGHFSCLLAFECGALVAVGRTGGEEACDEVVSYGDGTRIALAPERVDTEWVRGQVFGVGIRIEDEHGRPAHDWAGVVTVGVSGPAAVRTHLGDGGVCVGSGEGRALLIASGGEGPVSIRAEAAGLGPATVTLAPAEHGDPHDRE